MMIINTVVAGFGYPGRKLHTRSIPFLLLLFLFLSAPRSARSQFIAFWDHAPGTNQAQIHPNTSTGNIPLGPWFTTVQLKNVPDGSSTPVVMTVTNMYLGSGASVTFDDAALVPAPGTPLYNAFYYPTNDPQTESRFSYVYFGQAVKNLNSVKITNACVAFIFRNLNPAARYRFQGGAVRGGDATFRSRWTKVELAGADSFRPVMTKNVITSAQVGDLASNQVAANFACNHTADTGDMVEWDNIEPGADGTFSVLCTRYTGAVPGGSSSGGSAYGITGIHLEEKFLVTLQRAEDGMLQVSWPAGKGLLQESSDLLNWAPSEVANGAFIQPNGPRFFRLLPPSTP